MNNHKPMLLRKSPKLTETRAELESFKCIIQYFIIYSDFAHVGQFRSFLKAISDGCYSIA